ncbi:hypothetical protein B0H16DRAFT_1257575, partial [Mycena metata]
YAPPDDQIQVIRAHLAPHVERLASLKALIHDPSVQRDELMEYINLHTALISPVQRLPQDILQEIFLACLPTDRNTVMSVSEAPLLLGRICSGWRDIVLATPALWASLH